MSKKEKKVCGVGINDAPYAVTKGGRVDGKRKITWVCPYYVVWHDMLHRCYSNKYHTGKPTYINCTVCDEWIYFMAFRAWMEKQDWEGKHLDKDILIPENKTYAPSTCRFVDRRVNTFFIDCGSRRGEWPIGVSFDKSKGKFVSYCRNPFMKKLEHLGVFTCPNEAHGAWRKRKHELACMWADLQDDPLIAEALRKRFAPKEL